MRKGATFPPMKFTDDPTLTAQQVQLFVIRNKPDGVRDRVSRVRAVTVSFIWRNRDRRLLSPFLFHVIDS
jgi:hypothetical protein